MASYGLPAAIHSGERGSDRSQPVQNEIGEKLFWTRLVSGLTGLTLAAQRRLEMGPAQLSRGRTRLFAKRASQFGVERAFEEYYRARQHNESN